MIKRKLSLARRMQKKIIGAISGATRATSEVYDKANEQLQKLDEKHKVSDVLRRKGKKIRKTGQRFDKQLLYQWPLRAGSRS